MPQQPDDKSSVYELQKALAELESQKSSRALPSLLRNWRFWAAICIPVIFFIAFAC